MPKPFTIRIFVPQGNPEGLRIFDKMNWTGKGLIFPREEWDNIKNRNEFNQMGVYILYGYGDNQSIENDDKPTLYIGQSDEIRKRIASHYEQKDFWDKCLVFVSTNRGLNRAHITWLEYALINKAKKSDRSILDNSVEPNEPSLTEADKADIESFLLEINQILPLAGIHVFETPEPVSNPIDKPKIKQEFSPSNSVDTVIVAAHKENFEKVFLGQNCWYAIRIGGGKRDKIKFLATYQTYPKSAVTHYATIDRIEPYGDKGKYILYFSGKPKVLNPPIPLGTNTNLAIQGPRYTSYERLLNAKSLSDL